MNRTTVTLVIILVLLGIATFLVLRRPGESSATETTGKTLFDYDSSGVDNVEIRTIAGTTVLEKINGTWMVTAPGRYKADSAAVCAIVNQGKHVELKALVSSNPEKQSVFVVDSSAPFIRISEKGTERAAFRIGKVSSSFMETFVRREGSNDVWLASGFLTATFNRQAKDLRDKTVFRTERDLIKSLMYQYGDTTFTVAFQDTLWRVGNEPANDATVNGVLSALSRLQADDVIDTAFTPPKVIATITVLGTQIRYFYDTKKASYYVQTSESPQWYTSQSWKAMQVLKRKKDFVASPT
jgi:hypothetical protein